MKKKLLYINNFEAPYRVPFFNYLGQNYDMTIAFSQRPEERKERNLKWFQPLERNYKSLYLDTVQLGNIKIAFSVKKILKDYDIIFMDMYGNPTNMYAIYCLNRMKKPFVMSVDGILPKQNEKFLAKAIKRYFLNSPLKILSPGEYVDGNLKKYGVLPEKIARYHFTSLLKDDLLSEVPTFEEKLKLRKKLDMPLEMQNKVILTVGRFSYERGYGKGYDVLFKAMFKLPKAYHLYIVGDEPTQEFIDMKNKMRLDNIHFVGFKNKKELNEYYCAADLFCLQTRGDVWGLVINEAMATGLPVITTKQCVAGMELVKNGINGYIGDAEDDGELANNIMTILDNTEVRQNMGEMSLKIIREYTIEQMTKDHVKVLNSLIG